MIIQVGNQTEEVLLENTLDCRGARITVHKNDDGSYTGYKLYLGTNKVRWETQYNADKKRDGVAINYDENGNLIQSITFKNNEENGPWVKRKQGIETNNVEDYVTQYYKDAVRHGSYLEFDLNKHALDVKKMFIRGQELSIEDIKLIKSLDLVI